MVSGRSSLLKRLRAGGTNVFGEVVPDNPDGALAADIIERLCADIQQAIRALERCRHDERPNGCETCTVIEDLRTALHDANDDLAVSA